MPPLHQSHASLDCMLSNVCLISQAARRIDLTWLIYHILYSTRTAKPFDT